jgi:hypothetical protein
MNNLIAKIENSELSAAQANTLTISTLQENQKLKLDLDRTANLISTIATLIDSADLPNKITFGYALTNWKKLSNLIASIVKAIKQYKNGLRSNPEFLG